MKQKVIRKKIAHLRTEHLYEPDSRNIVFLSDLSGLFDEFVHIPGRALSLTYLFSGQVGQKVELVLSSTCEDGDSTEFMDYFAQRFEPYFSFESGSITTKQWAKLSSKMTHKYHLVPARRKYELLAPGMHNSVKPLLKLVEQVQMLGIKLTVQVTLKSLDLDGKKELLRQLPVAGAKMKLVSGGSSAIPSTLDWFSGSGGNESLTEDFHKILGYEIQISSAEKLNSHTEYIIRRGLLGELGEKFACKMQGENENELCYVLAENSSRILQFPLAKQSYHPGLTVQNQPLLFNEPSIVTKGITLGVTNRALSQKVIIPEEALNKHCFICGKTGVGKSTLMRGMITSIAEAQNQAVFLLDPHGDTAKEVIKHLPDNELDRIVYIDFAAENIPGLNMLDTSEQGMMFALGELEHYFLRLYGPEIFGPRIQDAFRSFLTLLWNPRKPGTLCDLLWAINLRDGRVFKGFEKIAIEQNNLGLRLFLEQITAHWGKDGSIEEMNAYFRAKFSPFTESVLRHIIGQQRTTLPFAKLIKEKKIVLLNLNKGQLSGRYSSLLGTIITAMLFQAVMHSGAGVETAEKEPVAIFIDECQNFISPTIADVLAEARKFKASLVLATQHLGQLDNNSAGFLTGTNLQEAILGNVGSLITFRSSSRDSKILAEEMGGNISPDQINSLPNYTAIARLEGHNSFDSPTMFRTQHTSPRRKSIDKVRTASVQRYCRSRSEVDAEINSRISSKLGWTEVPGNIVEDFFS